MKIGILQTGRAPDSIRTSKGDYDDLFKDLFAGHDLTFETFAVLDGAFPSGADAADGWLITGSRHSAYEDLPWIPPLEDFVREIAKTDLPLVGICFGHQIIAQALGGTVAKFERGWAIGPCAYTTVTGQEITMNAWHQDQVVTRPNGAQVLASNSFCENAILRYGNQILTFQAHPEFTPNFMSTLFRARKAVLPPSAVQGAERALGTQAPIDRMDGVIGAFFMRRSITI